MSEKMSALCHDYMARALEDGDIPIKFSRAYREHTIRVLDGGYSGIVINYCPWCGFRFPCSLRHDWFDTLEGIGIDPVEQDVPEEFSDERWYQKLGLE